MKVVAIPSLAVVVVGVLCLALANSGQAYFLPSAVSALFSAAGSLRTTLNNAGAQVSYKLSNDILTVEILNGTNSIGLVSLPLDALCKIPEEEKYVTCFICNNDCIYVHNTYGGKCGENPSAPGNFTCLCADSQLDAADRNISTNTKTTCQADLYPSPFSTYLADPALAQVLRTRMDAVQCLKLGDVSAASGYNSTGCAADCNKNHGYPSGVCGTATPKIGSPAYFNEQQPHFCTCN